MIELALYFVALLMTAVAVWRLPSALWGDFHRRALWGCYAGFAAALWIKSEAVRTALNHSHITDLSVLLKHYVSIAAILAILSYVVSIYGADPDGGVVPRHVRISRVVQRVGAKAAIVALTVMTVLFFTVVDRDKPSDNFVTEHAGQWGATAYMTVFYVYLGAAAAVCGYQWGSQTLRVTRPRLRLGLGMMATGMIIAVAYTTARSLFMWVGLLFEPSPGFATTFRDVTSIMQLSVFVLFATGASIPGSQNAFRRVGALRSLAHIYPLWRDLMIVFPNIPFAPPASRARELTRRDAPAEVRLDRWVHDIGDAIEKLRYYVPDSLLPTAQEIAASGRTPEQAGPVAEAHWIKAALIAKEQDHPVGPVAAFSTFEAPDADSEVAWLRRVRAAYDTVTRQDASKVLNSVRQSV